MLHKLIFKTGAYIRNPELFSYYRFLKQSERWPIEEIEAYQLKRFKELMLHADEKSAFYKSWFQKAGVTLHHIQSLKDLKKLPILTKKEILENTEAIQIKEGFKKLVFSETSGSTGEPLLFYRNSEWDSATRAAQLRGYSWYDVNPWEKNGYFWGYDIDKSNQMKMKVLDYLVNRFRIFSYDTESIKRFSEKLKKAVYLEGYSSMIYEVARLVNQHHLGPYHLKMVKGTSEMIYDSYQDEVKKAFGSKMVSEYGSAETGIIAYECRHGNMHIAMENVIVEEENGEAIITNLLSDSFPIIRYKLGDYIELDTQTKCACGMQHHIIKSVKGRTGSVVYGHNQKYPSLTFYYIFKNLSLHRHIVLNYQAIQKEKGKVDLYLDQKISQEELKCIHEEANKYFSRDMDIEVHQNQLYRDYTKKFKDFISAIEE